jgi:PGF-CTERM protein
MVALALFVLMAIAPVSAKIAENGTQIQLGSTVFIGEEGLNLTQAMNGAFTGIASDSAQIYNVPADLRIGWWASAAQITTTAPTRIINLDGRYKTFVVAPADFVGYTGNWYLIDNGSGTNAARLAVTTGLPTAVFNVQDPTLDIKVWDLANNLDVTGKSVPQGSDLAFKIETNMYAATYVNRNNTVYNRSFDYALLGAPGSAIMPDGTSSTWDGNGTGQVGFPGTNGTFVYEVYDGQTASNVWMVVNYTDFYTMTYHNVNSTVGRCGTYRVMYWNNSALTATSETLPYTARNFTTDAAGLVNSNVAWNGASSPACTWSPIASADGFINIKVKDESGTTLTALRTNSAGTETFSLLKNFVNIQPWTWGAATGQFWETDAVDFNNQYAYPVGTYTVVAESALNKMKDNYKNAGADYTGKTVSQSYTVTLVSDTVKVEANKDSVVRSKPFSVTVTGKPKTTYYVWVKGTGTMTGAYDNQPPMANLNQEGVFMDSNLAGTVSTGKLLNHPIGDYAYENGAGKIIYNDVCVDSAATLPAVSNWNRTRYYVLINTSSSGTRTVEFLTSNWTKAQRYTIRVEQRFPLDQLNATTGFAYPYSDVAGSAYQTGTVKSDEVDIKVEKGAVTIVAAGDQSYYLGEEIKFSGTNTETYKTYLFIVGPNLPAEGAQISSLNPRDAAVENQVPGTFKVVDVQGDNTWSWKWGTSNVALDAGTYTIYAVSQPNSKSKLQNAAYGTVSIIIKKPFVSATASQSTVAKGDKIFITGTAEGDPSAVMIWILGKNYPQNANGVGTESVNADGSFSYEVKGTTTETMYAGQYFVVVQHPMQNDIFDVAMCSNNINVCNYQLTSGATDQRIFTLFGAGSLQGSDAAEALVQGINDPNVDDTYTKLQFLIEEPVIRIDPIGDKRVGDKFTITAQTNLAVDDEILVEVYSSSFKPTQKSQSGEFSGATGTVKVTKGDSGMNLISFDVDSSTFKPDEYIVTAAAVIQTATGTALFNVLEGSAPTPVVTAVTTVAPAVTTAAPVVTTAAPVSTPTQSPGYGALIALIGLGAVAFIVVRRH